MLRVIAERILYVGLSSLFGSVQVATAHLWSSDPQLTHGTNGQSIELLVNDIESQIIQRLTDGDVQFVILHPVIRGENSAFRRAIAVVHLVVGRRVECRKFLTTNSEATQ